MTVPVQTPFTETTANGSTTVFPFGFLCLDEEDLEVSEDGVVITTGFAISGIGNISGGNVTFTVAPTNGTVITMALKPTAKREIDYQQTGDWNASSLNRDFDRLWLAIRSLGQSIFSSIKLPFSTTTEPIISEDSAERANKYISFDGSGNLELTVGPDLAAAIAAQVGAEAAAAIIVGFENKGAWLTATAYAVNNLVQESGNTYICLVAHTSGTFATDYGAGKWAVFAAKGTAGAGTGDMLGANNLSDVSNAATSRTNLGLGTAATKATGTTSGTVPLWESLPFNSATDKASGFTVVAGDRGKLFNCTAAMTIALTAAATLGNGFAFAVRNSGSGSVVIDPNSSETIDETSTITLAAGQSCIVVCDGDEFYSVGRSSTSGSVDVQTFTTTGANTWNKPSFGTMAFVQMWAGGGSGAKNVWLSSSGGGGGGGYAEGWFPLSALGATETATVGAGGAGVSSTGSGNSGDSSSFGSWLSVSGGAAGTNSGGGDGRGFSGGNGGAIGSSVAENGSPAGSVFGGGGGGGGDDFTGVAGSGGNSYYGGAGGGGKDDTQGTGGSSSLGGAGGNSNSGATGDGVAGGVKGGGGGACTGSGTSGAGGRGEIRVTVF